ncbi:hypothetical protein FHS90_002259 [Rufibacter quisquiliarum]|uniref:Uncharacterized protein n=1 Tax=Rufibacter quisquiliarum TaxID=1549639 RepID=A0A839GUT0_9BACT|nr:hypothetical protein [Rufibacter quisquiliarum]
MIRHTCKTIQPSADASIAPAADYQINYLLFCF